MSAPAFTPGPWITVHQPEDGGAFHIDSYAGLHIAQTIGGLVGEQANACLIAAAPDLYAALSNLLADLAPIVNEFHNSKVNGAWPPAPGDARALASELTRISVPARAALAKATGVQP